MKMTLAVLIDELGHFANLKCMSCSHVEGYVCVCVCALCAVIQGSSLMEAPPSPHGCEVTLVSTSGWWTEEDRAHGGSLGRLRMVYFTPAYITLVQIQ